MTLRPLLPLALSLGIAVQAEAQGLFLHAVKVDAPAGMPEDVAPLWRVALVATDAAALAEILPPVLPREVAGDRVVVSVEREQVLGGELRERHRRPSFVIDFGEPSVVAVVAKLRAAHPEPTVEDLVRFTDRSIPNKRPGRGWDFASRVAAHGEGDCTEHAVLLTALARAVGRPARVVVGIALIRDGDTVFAGGHAWAELHDGTRWVVADSTADPGSAAVRWIPFHELEDEGPGFRLPLAGWLTTGWPQRLEILPAPAPKATVAR